MPSIDVLIESKIELSTRARQVCGMFDCPPEEKQSLRWTADLPIEQRPWNVGLIVGPSGSGKTVCARSMWPEIDKRIEWRGASIIDDFPKDVPLETITKTLNSVGFNTVPAWLRPFGVLSNGEKFRCEIARHIVEASGVVVVDEFTSVVDRQVAKVASHCVQKTVRANNQQFVAVSCHSDIIDWLQPDWIFEPAERLFRWRLLQRRPEIHVEMARLPYESWRVFAPYHYLTAEMSKSVRCFGLWADGTLASFCGVIHQMHPKVKNIKRTSRSVTLPDWQGLGLAFALRNTLAAAYGALGYFFHCTPAHPSFIRSHRKEEWMMIRKPGLSVAFGGGGKLKGGFSRPCATFKYIGPKMPIGDAQSLIFGTQERVGYGVVSQDSPPPSVDDERPGYGSVG